MDDQSEKPCIHARLDKDERSLLDYWQVIWKGKALIILIVMIIVVSTAILSLFMTNIYQATAVIIPVAKQEKEGLVSQLTSQFGIATPGSWPGLEVVSILTSNILREKVIQKYNLLPVLFHEDWDEEKKMWKKEEGIFPWLRKLLRSITPENTKGGKRKEGTGPEISDGVRKLKEIVRVKNNLKKENTITITVRYHDPEMAAKIVDYFLATLLDRMTSETKRVALVNMKYLEEQVVKYPDPFIKQKIFSLILEQVETSMMAEVKENFAFKVVDPPREPDRKVWPIRGLIVMLSFVASLFIGILAVFSKEYFKKVKASS
jgi:uncharacterized protein involved in exopolysaccharide biosynthesis